MQKAMLDTTPISRVRQTYCVKSRSDPLPSLLNIKGHDDCFALNISNYLWCVKKKSNRLRRSLIGVSLCSVCLTGQKQIKLNVSFFRQIAGLKFGLICHWPDFILSSWLIKIQGIPLRSMILYKR